MNTTSRLLLPTSLCLALAACAGTGTGTRDSASQGTLVGPAPDAHARQAPADAASAPRTSPYAPAQEDLSKRGDYVAGGLYAPGVKDTVPDYIPDVDAIPEPEVRAEPRARTGNRGYTVLGRRYEVLDSAHGYVEKGGASYYGRKFHGRRTSSGEVYDMFAFTAAHRSLPLPSFVRVTNLDNGRSIVVRVNDRGPFHDGRIIDLSYAAAVKLGYRERGVANVQVEALTPDEMRSRQVAQANPSAIDRLVGGLPQAAAKADPAPPAPVAVAPPVAAPQASPDAGAARFDMHQDGRTMTADEFDAWLRSRQIRIATGKPGTPAAAPPAPAAPVAVAAAPVSAPTVAAGSSTHSPVTLQVASFSNPDNARQALSLLEDAAIAGARLLDATVEGRRIWRLRIGPVHAGLAPELSARVAGLGFGQPTRVRD